MKRTELTETFIMISNLKKSSFFIYIKYFSALKGKVLTTSMKGHKKVLIINYYLKTVPARTDRIKIFIMAIDP